MREALPAIRANYRGIATVLVAVTTATQALFVVPEMTEFADEYADFTVFVVPNVAFCDPFSVLQSADGAPHRNPLYWWVYCVSWQATGLPNLLPMMFNILVIPAVYLAGYAITKDRLAGLIAMMIFVYNPLYSDWRDSAVYNMMWTMFLLLSVYFVYTARQKASLLMYVLAVLSKGLVILYYPAYLYSCVKNRQYLSALIPVALTVVTVVSVWHFFSIELFVGNAVGFYPERFADGMFRIFESIWPAFPLFMAFVIIDRFFNGGSVRGKADVWVWMATILASTPMIYVFTQQQQFGYRFVPLGAFMSIYGSIVILQLANFVLNRRLKMIL